MNIQAIKLQVQAVTGTSLVWNKTTKTHDEVTVSPTVWVNDAGRLCVSAEDGLDFADYWGDCYIASGIEAVAKANGTYWEWENCGCISLAN